MAAAASAVRPTGPSPVGFHILKSFIFRTGIPPRFADRRFSDLSAALTRCGNLPGDEASHCETPFHKIAP
ncbi:hypothetical protein KKY_2066 [Pelagibacterium halotolerans B2]|uniref:Uncharacterized protein n=1 Tax=Pelagibacterium halotolerans (strain DSM 22347 / JCM 15775 / CGMCC 1.7692 / B2) TaxID=1082931 RepID=G4RGN7_PELHB|nr:hypothetical protein KKY_2066 [Pelagibacterium halotolerans B2]